MKLSLFALLLVSTSAFSAERYIKYEDDPNHPVNAKKNFSDTVAITWTTAKNVTKACNEERAIRGEAEYTYVVEACAFWDKTLGMNTCHVITAEKTTLITAGHELLHCFQGEWHQHFE